MGGESFEHAKKASKKRAISICIRCAQVYALFIQLIELNTASIELRSLVTLPNLLNDKLNEKIMKAAKLHMLNKLL